MTQNYILMGTLILVWILGGQMLCDIKNVNSNSDKDLGFFDRLWFTLVWPIIVLYNCIKYT